MMHQVLSEFVNFFVDKHFYLNNVNFSLNISEAVLLSWLELLSSKQEMLGSKLTIALFLAAKYQTAAKNKAAVSFQLSIS